MGPIQVPLGISPPEFRVAAQWTGLIPCSALPPQKHALTTSTKRSTLLQDHHNPCSAPHTPPRHGHLHNSHVRFKALLLLQTPVRKSAQMLAGLLHGGTDRCLSVAVQLNGKQVVLTAHARGARLLTVPPSSKSAVYVSSTGECPSREKVLNS